MAEALAGLTFDGLESAAAPAMPVDETALIAGLRSGREQAYETLIERYQHPVYGLVFRLLGDAAESADVTQEVFLKIFRKIGAFREHSSLRTWIYRIAVNEAYNYRRWFTRRQRQALCSGADGEARRNAALTALGPSPFDLAAGHEMRAKVERALGEVNPNFRAAVVLRDIEELSYEEIAAILDLSLGTVKSRILRGREALRRILAAEFESDVRAAWGHRGLGLAKTVD